MSKLITFDDGYETTYTKAYPYMKKKGLKGIVFVTTDWIGKKDRLSINQLLELRNAGWTIGSHTCSHPNLTKIPLEQANFEIEQSQKELRNLSFNCDCFAYPYSRWNKDVVDIVRKYYRWARSVDSTDKTRYTKLVDGIKFEIVHSIDQPEYPCNMSFDTFKELCSLVDQPNLLCFIAWGRPELTKKSFEALLKNKRKQDKLLVIDQEMLNTDLFLKYKDQIDWLFFLKDNYVIGPIWILIKQVLVWLKKNQSIFFFDDNLGWYPEFVTIVENDAYGKDFWIEKVLKIFDEGDHIGIASGYEAPEHKPIRKDGDILIKQITPGVQITFKAEYFTILFDHLKRTSQDLSVSIKNKENGKVIGVIPNLIEHIGWEQRKQK